MVIDPLVFEPLDWQRHLKQVSKAEQGLEEVISELKKSFVDVHNNGRKFYVQFQQAMGPNYRVDVTSSRLKSRVDEDIITSVITQYVISDTKGRTVFEEELPLRQQNTLRSIREDYRQAVEAFEQLISEIYDSYAERMETLAELSMVEQLKGSEDYHAAIYFRKSTGDKIVRAVIELVSGRELSIVDTVFLSEPNKQERLKMSEESQSMNVYFVWHTSKYVSGEQSYCTVRRMLCEEYLRNAESADQLDVQSSIPEVPQIISFKWEQSPDDNKVYLLLKQKKGREVN